MKQGLHEVPHRSAAPTGPQCSVSCSRWWRRDQALRKARPNSARPAPRCLPALRQRDPECPGDHRLPAAANSELESRLRGGVRAVGIREPAAIRCRVRTAIRIAFRCRKYSQETGRHRRSLSHSGYPEPPRSTRSSQSGILRMKGGLK
jgi:hypothetical protein